MKVFTKIVLFDFKTLIYIIKQIVSDESKNKRNTIGVYR